MQQARLPLLRSLQGIRSRHAERRMPPWVPAAKVRAKSRLYRGYMGIMPKEMETSI